MRKPTRVGQPAIQQAGQPALQFQPSSAFGPFTRFAIEPGSEMISDLTVPDAHDRPVVSSTPLLLGILTLALVSASSRAADTADAGFRLQEVTPAKPPGPVPAGHTVGFLEVPSNLSGINFSNTVSSLRMAANNNLMNGSGLAAGDFDQDGLCDLYFCALDGRNALYRNLGGWRFEEMAESAGVACPDLPSTGACFADVDGDGRLDLLVSTLGQGVHLFLNQGDGRFLEATANAGLPANTGSTTLALGDVDGDDDLDLYVANYGAHSILRSGGRAEMRLENGRWVVLGPYANRLRFVDGRLEELGEPDGLYLNNGRGQFTQLPWGSEFFRDPEGKPVEAPWDFGLNCPNPRSQRGRSPRYLRLQRFPDRGPDLDQRWNRPVSSPAPAGHAEAKLFLDERGFCRHRP